MVFMTLHPSIITLTCADAVHYGTRLDKFLTAHLSDYSRNYFQELIDTGCVTINNRPALKSNYCLKPLDTVTVTLKSKQSNFQPAPVAFEVLDENEDFVIINKPAGLLVHHAPATPDELTLVNGLLYRYGLIDGFEDKTRPGIVHRIDKHTSGLLVVARTPKAHFELAKLFQDRHINKTYLALVTGHPADQGTINTPIGRHPTERHKMATKGIELKPALTHFVTTERFENYSLVHANIITGRTHQIRVHFASIGHPLLGDAIYGKQSPDFDRQALHAWHMSFTYRGKDFTYECPLPEDFNNILEKLRKTNSFPLTIPKATVY
jgi:23S rRNA pseudouridine1911/1915/1917 synthase